MQALTGFRALVEREIVRFFSVFMQTIFPPVVSSFLYIFIFGFSLGSRIHEIQGVPYLTFLVPGLIMMVVIEGSYANSSSSLFISRWAGHIEELLVAPLSYFEMVLAMIIGSFARSFVAAGGVYLVSLIFVQFPVHNFWLVLYFAFFVSLIFSCLGLIVALLAEEFEHLSIATTFIITPLVFLGGVFHSITLVPGPLKWLTQFNPIFYMVNGLRYGMLGIADVGIGQAVTVVFFMFLSLFMLTEYLFRIGFKLRK